MLEQRRLELRLYDVLVKLLPEGKPADSLSQETLVAAGLASFHDFYGKSPGIFNQNRSVILPLMLSRVSLESWESQELSSHRTTATNMSNRDVYFSPGEEYVEFSRFWHESLPENMMAFPAIFGTIKDRSNSRFPRLVEDYYW